MQPDSLYLYMCALPPPLPPLGASRTKARNGNYRDIVRGIRIDPHGMDCLTGYHHVFWVGDLNYRLDHGSQATNPTESPSQADFDDIVDKVCVQRGMAGGGKVCMCTRFFRGPARRLRLF